MTSYVFSRRLLIALALIGGLGVGNRAAAQTVPHKEKAVGTIDSLSFPDPATAVQEWSGVGQATQMGRYTQSGHHAIDLATGVVVGKFTSTAADGSTISGTYDGTVTEIAPGVLLFDVTAYWLTGTDRLEGVTGQAEVLAVVLGIDAGSTFNYSDEGYWILP
jgi:hypothetical protein